jgi:hypothetical protein
MRSLALVVVIVNTLLFSYVLFHHVTLGKPAGIFSLLSIPIEFPSLWNILQPLHSLGTVVPSIVFILQIFLTGGLFGSLIRSNRSQTTSAASFASDGIQSFGRLFIWNLLWTIVIPFFLFDIGRAFLPLAQLLAVLMLILRFMFLFVDISLVSEQQLSMGQAIQNGVQALFNGFLAMIPFGLGIAIVTGLGLTYSARLSIGMLWFVGIVYCLLMLWLMHMVVARYLFYAPRRVTPE